MNEWGSERLSETHSWEKAGVPVLNFPFTWDKQAITHPFFPMLWPSSELKHTLLVCVPVGSGVWRVEVVSEWRVEEMGKAVVKWLRSDRQREK